MQKKLSQLYTQKLFLKSKYVFKTAFFYIKKYQLDKNKIKDIIVISKKCGNAVQRNYIRRITKVILREFESIFDKESTYIIIYEKKNLKNVNYNTLKTIYLSLQSL